MSLIPLAPFLLRHMGSAVGYFRLTDSLRLPPAEQLTFVKHLPKTATGKISKIYFESATDRDRSAVNQFSVINQPSRRAFEFSLNYQLSPILFVADLFHPVDQVSVQRLLICDESLPSSR